MQPFNEYAVCTDELISCDVTELLRLDCIDVPSGAVCVRIVLQISAAVDDVVAAAAAAAASRRPSSAAEITPQSNLGRIKYATWPAASCCGCDEEVNGRTHARRTHHHCSAVQPRAMHPPPRRPGDDASTAFSSLRQSVLYHSSRRPGGRVGGGQSRPVQ